jgi:hypothetical protein
MFCNLGHIIFKEKITYLHCCFDHIPLSLIVLWLNILVLIFSLLREKEKGTMGASMELALPPTLCTAEGCHDGFFVHVTTELKQSKVCQRRRHSRRPPLLNTLKSG